MRSGSPCLASAGLRGAGCMRHCHATAYSWTLDPAMLINCVAYEHGKKLADIAVPAIGEYLHRPDCFVWVALKDASDAELLEMQQQFQLHDLAVEDARHGHQRPKIEEYGDTVFAVMHMVEYAPTDELRVGELSVFVGTNFVLSVRSRSTHGFLGVRERAEREPQMLRHGSSFVFYALMDSVVDRYFPVIDAMEEELETIEDKIFEPGTARQNIERLYALKRRVGVLRHAVVPLMEATGKLFGGRVPPVCTRSQDYFRDVYDHLVRSNATLDNLRDTITTAIQVNLSMVTIEESETTKRLAAWAGIFAVATAFVGVWGMNFEHMPELKWQFGYPLALGAITAVCGLMYWRFRKSGWL
jgi:magnesium transporter